MQPVPEYYRRKRDKKEEIEEEGMLDTLKKILKAKDSVPVHVFTHGRPYPIYCPCPPHLYPPYLVGDGRITHG